MEGVYTLGVFALAMFFGSYLAGLIPLAFTMSESRIRRISIFGAGLLVGTALSVIIPEGVEVLYSARFGTYRYFAVLREQQQQPQLEFDEEHDDSWIHKAIGFSLIIGFLVMLLIDETFRAATSGERSRFGLTATIGLIVHAAADGVALGSASATNRADVQFIVFLAIMLHKAPAAFGLVSFLLVEGLERVRVRRHLLAFSLSAPLTAMLTFYIIAMFGSNSSLSSHSFTGILMLFSAGTFLYVATVHVLPELVLNDYQLMPTSSNSGHSHSSGVGGNIKELSALIVGALFPAIIASGHSHSH
uniref:Zinc transporter ZIP9 n=1 Tax=Syphacia muris TaxID=451379 RepID=A0A0N5AJD6_9BILA